MTDRTPLMLTGIVVLVLAAVYLNLDLVVDKFAYAPQLKSFLTWQGDEKLRGVGLREGLDLQGGLQVLLQAAAAVSPTELEQAATIMKDRVDQLGVTEPLVQTQGLDKIVVELPGVADPDLAVRTVSQAAFLEFVYAGTSPLVEGDEVVTTYPQRYEELPEDKQKPHLADVPAAGAAGAVTATTGVTPTSGTTRTGATGALTGTGAVTTTASTKRETVYPTIITGQDIEFASVVPDPITRELAVSFQLKADGSRRVARFTTAHHDDVATGKVEVMAILLDKKVISSPTVREPITGGQGQISGNFTQAEATSLETQLNSGALPVQMQVVGQTLIGPTLGREAVDAAIKGGLVGFLVVMAFMLVYYRLPGLVANLALLVYALLTLSLFRLIPVTLTLAGIAGFILSIGMAVDANILIFERMKEELRAGRRIRAAMETGFARAWPSIRDSNTSTLITCAILFWFGNQFGATIVKGFAITLALGVLMSLFTAITVTRTFLKVANAVVLREDAGVHAIESPRLRALFGF